MSANDPEFSIQAMELGPMENFVYLLHDHKTDRVAVVDPAWEVDKIISQVQSQGRVITDILLTHSHFDHINGIEGILAQFDAQLHLLKAEAAFWGQHEASPNLHHGGDTILLGNTKIDVLHTPGHTPGSACYHIGENLIAGDTMFVFGCGRCDLAGGDPNQMFATLTKIKQELPPNTILHPGHNYSVKPTSCLSDEIDGNPFLHFDQVDDFVKYRMHDHDRIRHSPYDAVIDSHTK